MDENTQANIKAALESARADFIQGLSKIDRALATLQGTVTAEDALTAAIIDLTGEDFADRLRELYDGADGIPEYDDVDADEDAEPVIPTVTYDIDADGNVVESEGAAELFEATAEALEEIHALEDEGDVDGFFGEFNGENRIELTFVKVDDEGEPDGSLTVDEVRQILVNPFTQNSLSNFGNLTLASVRAGEVEASKVAVLNIVNEGRAPIEALARQMMGYRGTYPFPGIGIISVVGRAVLA